MLTLLKTYLKFKLKRMFIFQLGRLECVQWLVRHSNLRDKLTSRDGERSLLHMAAKYGKVSIHLRPKSIHSSHIRQFSLSSWAPLIGLLNFYPLINYAVDADYVR